MMDMIFSRQLRACACCPRECGVDRLAGRRGFCGVADTMPVPFAGRHFGEEPPISGTRGSGTIFFGGCNLRCVFCQNHQISQECGTLGDVSHIDPVGLAAIMLRLRDEGAHNINLVSPGHVALAAADAIVAARSAGLDIPVAYNSNGYDSVAVLRQLEGLVDIYLPDFKYADDTLARRCSGVADYSATAEAALREMLRQVGRLRLDDEGVAERGVLVRHLVLPNETANSRACLHILAAIDPRLTVSIMSQYSPRHKAVSLPGLNRSLHTEEYAEVIDCAVELGLENAFVQDLASQEVFLPDFSHKRPFR